MRGAFAIGKISTEERDNILNQHRQVYDGYKTMLPQVSNTQPLYVQDFANDKGGMVVNNKGEVKPYTNMGINEQKEEKNMCSECGGMMQEGECSECGWKSENVVEAECSECGSNEMEEQMYEIEFDDESDDDDMEGFEEVSVSKPEKKPFMPKVNLNKIDLMKFIGDDDELEEETGHLDDIYHEEDINNKNEFDYVNEMNIEPAAETGYPVNEYETMESAWMDEELDEISVSDLKKGGKYKYTSPSFEDELEFNKETDDRTKGDKMYSFKGQKASHLLPKKHIEDYLADLSGFEGEMDEVDISGSQGIYGGMDPAYDFMSDGPGKAGPYQTREEEMEEEWSEVDEDLQESFVNQKNRIMEMMNRMKVIK